MPGRDFPQRSLLADGSAVRFLQLKDGQLGIEVEVKRMRIVDRKSQPIKGKRQSKHTVDSALRLSILCSPGGGGEFGKPLHGGPRHAG